MKRGIQSSPSTKSAENKIFPELVWSMGDSLMLFPLSPGKGGGFQCSFYLRGVGTPGFAEGPFNHTVDVKGLWSRKSSRRASLQSLPLSHVWSLHQVCFSTPHSLAHGASINSQLCSQVFPTSPPLSISRTPGCEESTGYFCLDFRDNVSFFLSFLGRQRKSLGGLSERGEKWNCHQHLE